jgi:hypothetical protein
MVFLHAIDVLPSLSIPLFILNRFPTVDVLYAMKNNTLPYFGGPTMAERSRKVHILSV